MSQRAKGVYSTRAAPGAGGAAGMGPRRTAPQKRYWLVWEHDENYVEVQPVNKNLVPTGKKRLIPLYEFKNEYEQEPGFVVEADRSRARPLWQRQPKETSPEAAPEAEEAAAWQALQEEGDAPGEEVVEKVDLDREPFDDSILDDTFLDEALGEAAPEQEPRKPAPPRPQPPEPPKPEKKPEPAVSRKSLELERVEREARSAFGLGLSHLKRGNSDRARALFEEVAGIEADFEPEHKHMFNEFGINLRKSGMPDVALKHYRRALQISPGDENLHHNLARIYWELGDKKNCERELRKSLEINPELHYSTRFLRYIKKQKVKKRGIFHDILPRKGGKRQ